MFAVIFKATMNPNISAAEYDLYLTTATKMRELAFAEYGCIDFTAVTEGQEEIAISYWHDEAAIKKWKSDTEHALAQAHGQHHWYKAYTVEVVEIKRAYQFSAS